MTDDADARDGLLQGPDGAWRCWWQGEKDDYRRYHDEEWGRPVADPRTLFEKLCLEGFQSGLSWLTILRKRENFRAGFAGFDIDRVADFGEDDVARLLADAGIVRHKAKILSVINNARRARAMRDAGVSLAALVWSYEPDPATRPPVCDRASLSALGRTPESTALSKRLLKDGWSFVGPTTVYAFMQSMGVVNDHLEGCCCRAPVEALRAAFVRPR
ncbi:DNA-3-methyladenine glycosylase I [Methylobrevis pamukkalensis]|uniref:DNA-3-methyladenine glycosylase 1 n=1 Tax=Methylobrevis pamukkalensis TaxID=1439726 RepID=A0A1E3H5X9_9HYPH|nr:DNA-3-methyladenine glycosylase I [Methylobrevis pamukkalensis]ODN71714.1 DNA-3-methyladenine glycosylase 1 [Methylobrevis pamukkalensis]